MYLSTSCCASRIIKSCIGLQQTLRCISSHKRKVHSLPVQFNPKISKLQLGLKQIVYADEEPILKQYLNHDRLLIQTMKVHESNRFCKNTRKDETMDPVDESLEEWIDPDKRQDMGIFKDTEMKGLLRELAADFGEGDSQSKQDKEVLQEDVAVSFDGHIVVKKDVVKELSRNEVNHISKNKKYLPPVFDVDGITELLREENALDLCVIKVPRERQYVDYFIVVTARSSRHLNAMAQSINKIYKQRKSDKHTYILVEGKGTDDWICLDFGNIVVHFMTEEIRELYELEKLWLLGPEYDDQVQRMKVHQDSIRQVLVDPELLEKEEPTEPTGDSNVEGR